MIFYFGPLEFDLGCLNLSVTGPDGPRTLKTYHIPDGNSSLCVCCGGINHNSCLVMEHIVSLCTFKYLFESDMAFGIEFSINCLIELYQ